MYFVDLKLGLGLFCLGILCLIEYDWIDLVYLVYLEVFVLDIVVLF